MESLKRYEANVERLEKRFSEVERRKFDLRADAQKVFEQWKNAEEEYAKATGDYDSCVWLD